MKTSTPSFYFTSRRTSDPLILNFVDMDEEIEMLYWLDQDGEDQML